MGETQPMADLGGLPKLPAACSQCGEPFWARACGPTHAAIWASITEPVMLASHLVRGGLGPADGAPDG